MAEIIVLLSSDEECCASNSNIQPLETNNCDKNSKMKEVKIEDHANGQTDTFQQFLQTCKSHISNPNDHKILQHLNDRYEKVDVQYKSSPDFIKFVTNTEAKLKTDPNNVFVYILELSNELKVGQVRQSRRSNNNKRNHHPVTVKQEHSENDTNAVDYCNNNVDDNVDGAVQVPEDDGLESAKRNRQIKKLEKLLRLLSRKIKKYEVQELDSDHLERDDSYYLEEDRYKRRFIKVWKTLCKLKKCEDTAGRYIEKKFRYKGSRYPEINTKISKWINKHKKFPDFPDVLELVTQVVGDHELHLKHQQIYVLAQSVFTEVGDELSRRRRMDFTDTLNSFQDELLNDPADTDLELATKLEQSRHLAKQRIDQVLEDFTQKQLSMTSVEEAAKDRAGSSNSSVTADDAARSTRANDENDENDENDDDDGEMSDKCDDIQTITDEFKDELEKEDESTNAVSVSDEDDSSDDSSSSEDENYANEGVNWNDNFSQASTSGIHLKSVTFPLKRCLDDIGDEPTSSPNKLPVLESPFVRRIDVSLVERPEGTLPRSLITFPRETSSHSQTSSHALPTVSSYQDWGDDVIVLD